MLYKFTSLVYSNAKGNIQIMKVDCSAPCAPAIAASIRNPGYCPPYSYWFVRPMSMTRCMPACAPHGRCTGLS